MAKHLILIDSSGFAYRAYHGGSKFPRYRQSDGMPTGTVLAFMDMILGMMGQAKKADPVSHAAAVFDHPAKTFRHDLFPEYKANRSERDPELTIQLPVMREVARALGIMPVEVEGFEADDVIATLARRGVEAGLRVTIVSSDKDFGQLVVDGKVEIVDHKSNKRLLAADVEKKFGVPPAKVIDVQALCGDAVDNIHGVPGIGQIQAAALVRKLGSLHAVMREAHKDVGYRMTAAQKLEIAKRTDEILLYRKLVTLRQDVPLPWPPACTADALIATVPEPSHVKELLRALEAEKRFAQLFETSRPATTVESVTKISNATEWHAAALVEFEKKLKSPSHKIRLPAPDEPQVGWYRRRLVKDGPWVPARIWRQPMTDFMTDKDSTSHEELRCQVGDIARPPADQWNFLLNNPISRKDYDFMMVNRTWVKKYGAPGEPEHNEDKPIDWNKVPI